MYAIIVNKVAGSGRGLSVFHRLKQSTIYKENDCRAFFTAYPKHAEKLVEQLVALHGEQLKAIIVIGGDGTLHEVLNGMINNLHVPISFIPAGSGNDFARGYHLKDKPDKILESVINNQAKQAIWPGNYVINGRNSNSSRLFANSIGFGFDAEIAKAANQSRYKKVLNKLKLGSLVYVIALLDVLRNFKPKTIELEIDGKQRKLDKVWMVTVANQPYYGGGMKIIPSARNQPRFFPILVIQDISVWKVLLLFITVFTGKHITFKEVHVYQATSMKISTEQSIFFQVDGQLGSCYTCSIKKLGESATILGGNGNKSLKSHANIG